MPNINSFFEIVSEAIEAEIQSAPTLDEGPAHWIVVLDDQGAVAAKVEDVSVGSVLAGHIANGAEGAAFVTQTTAGLRETVMAEVLMAEPRNSDVRRAYVARTASGAEIGAWEHIV